MRFRLERYYSTSRSNSPFKRSNFGLLTLKRVRDNTSVSSPLKKIECCNLLVFRPGLKSLTYIFVNQLLVKITSGTLWLLDAVSLRGRVRRLLR